MGLFGSSLHNPLAHACLLLEKGKVTCKASQKQVSKDWAAGLLGSAAGCTAMGLSLLLSVPLSSTCSLGTHSMQGLGNDWKGLCCPLTKGQGICQWTG